MLLLILAFKNEAGTIEEPSSIAGCYRDLDVQVFGILYNGDFETMLCIVINLLPGNLKILSMLYDIFHGNYVLFLVCWKDPKI